MTFEAALITGIGVVFTLLVGSNTKWWLAWRDREERHDQALVDLAAAKDEERNEIVDKKDAIITELATQKDAALAQVGVEKDRIITFLERMNNIEEV